MVNFPKHVSIERERELVDLIKEGSIEARNELVEVNLRYFRVINHKFGEAIGLTKEETEDIFQTFIVEYALRATKKYIPQREETRFVHYLGRYAYRNMLEIAKRDIPGFKGHVKYHPSIPFSTKKDLEDIHSTEEVNEEKPAKKERSNFDDKVIFVGGKPFMSYVTGVVMQFTTRNVPEVVVKARGKFISRGVDIAEVATKRFLEDTVEVSNMKIDSEEFENKEGKQVRVSTMEITVKKK